MDTNQSDTEAAAAAAAMARRRKVHTVACEQCGITITGLRAMRSCSARCRMAAMRARRREQPTDPKEPTG